MEENNKKNDFLLPASIIVAGVMISASIIYLVGSRDAGPSNQPSEGGSGVDVAAILAVSEDDVILGDPDAPVSIVIYGDYECPFCGKMFQEAEQVLREKYVETGKAFMIYRDFPLDGGPQPLHPNARSAAEAANCAKDQGKFWIYHDTLFEKQNQLASINYVSLAGELGLDSQAFSECVTSGKYKDKVQKDQDGGILIGVNGTPATFVNSQLVPGAQPTAVFESVIEKALEGEL